MPSENELQPESGSENDATIDEPKTVSEYSAAVMSVAPPEMPTDDHLINAAIAERVGVTVTLRQTPVGTVCDRDTGGVWAPVTCPQDALFAAARVGYKTSEGDDPRDICIGILKRG